MSLESRASQTSISARMASTPSAVYRMNKLSSPKSRQVRIMISRCALHRSTRKILSQIFDRASRSSLKLSILSQGWKQINRCSRSLKGSSKQTWTTSMSQLRVLATQVSRHARLLAKWVASASPSVLLTKTTIEFSQLLQSQQEKSTLIIHKGSTKREKWLWALIQWKWIVPNGYS